MNLQSRLFRILKYLTDMNEATTISRIADHCGVSKRTIRSDLDRLDTFFVNRNAKIIRKPGVGVWFEGKSNRILKDLAELASGRKYFGTPIERQLNILSSLLLGERLDSRKLANQMFISDSTLRRDMQRVDLWLKPHDLALEHLDGVYYISGSELAIREALVNLLFPKSNRDNKLSPMGTPSRETLLSNLDLNNSISTIRSIVISEISQLTYSLTEDSISGLVYHLAILLIRLEANQARGDWLDFSDSIRDRQEFDVADQISRRVEQAFNLSVPAGEKYYIALRILAAKIELRKDQQQANVPGIDPMFYSLARGFSQIAGALISMPLENDPELISALAMHLQPAIHRLRSRFEIHNPVLDVIRERYPLLFVIAQAAGLYLEEQTGLRIPADELGYLAAHIGAAVERIQAQPPRIPILLVHCGGPGSLRFLRNTLERRFRDAKIVGVVSTSNVAEQVSSGRTSLVLSTVPLRLPNVPVLVIDQLPTEEDLENVAIKLTELKWKKDALSKEKQLLNELRRGDMLEDALSPQTILLECEAANWEEAVRLAGDLLKSVDSIEDRYIDAMIRAVKEIGPYMVIAPGIAMPHARPEDGAKSVGISLVRLREPVLFPNREDNPVSLIIGLAADKPDAHLLVMAKLARILLNENLVKVLFEARTAAAIMDMVRSVELEESI